MRKLLAVIGFAMVAAGCGGGSPTAPTAPPAAAATPTVARAVLSVTQNGTAQLCLSPTTTFTYRLRVPIQVRETAGLSANINFIRLDLLSAAGVSLERREIGANTIIAGIGTNIVGPGATNNWAFSIDFNNSDFSSARFLFNFGDAKGNSIDVTLTGLNPLTVVAACSTI